MKLKIRIPAFIIRFHQVKTEIFRILSELFFKIKFSSKEKYKKEKKQKK